MLKISPDRHRQLTFWGLVCIAAGLPLSVFTISVGLFILAANWLLQGDFKKRLTSFFSDPLSLILISVYFLLLLGMIHTENTQQGLKELRIKLPILLIPLLLFTMHMPKKKRLQDVLMVFVLSTVLATVMGSVNRFWFEEPNYLNKRDLGLFTSHIRLGLMVVFSFFILGYHLVAERKNWSITEKVLAGGSMLWLFFFLVLLESPSAYISFAILLGFTLLRALFVTENNRIRIATVAIILIGIISSSLYLTTIYNRHYFEVPWDYRTQVERTVNGRLYAHQKDVLFRENGHRVWNYVCLQELQNEWPKKSDLALESSDKSGQELKFTLIRYMTSLGLKKDSVGIHALTEKDIRNIEHGFTNHRYTDRWGVARRTDQLLWEVEQYSWNGDPNASSLIQRLYYFEVGAKLFKDNWIIGVGTGDLYSAFKAYYKTNDLGLMDERQTISHNQYLSIGLGLGLFGLAWFCFALFYPMRFYWKDYLYASFLLLITVSMLSDNTLDSQQGVTLFAFFNALLMIRKEYDS